MLTAVCIPVDKAGKVKMTTNLKSITLVDPNERNVSQFILYLNDS